MRYEDRVFKALFDMDVNAAFSIEKTCMKANREKFIDLIKEFIRMDAGRFDNFFIEFSNDYSSVRKKKYII